ncbi:protein phosphatase 2C domain-containing protein [Halobacillus salinus]|uniref:protein phosphatase 2C domain-containing protein n=1 Tax=Halobacillus salinus TaxID=192814 RepID=UPI0009A8CAA7|nr:protein phosphatase 2C domain-containing protein [Halobacillus salinus]
MMIKIESIQRTSPAKEECEDALTMNKGAGVYAVFDGATPLVPFRDSDDHNGAYLASNTFKRHFDQMEEGDSLKGVIKEANRDLRQQMISANIDLSKGYERWTTCVAAVKIEDSHFEYAHLGDCMIIIEDKNGEKVILTEDTVEGISERARKKRGDDRKRGVSVPEESYFKDRIEALKYNRTLANMEGGYTVADGMPAAIDALQAGNVSMEKVREILILSDGLFHPDWSLDRVFNEIQQSGLNDYVEQLTDLLGEQNAHIDDRTAIRIQWGALDR